MFLRPSFLYDSTRPFTIPIAAMGGAAAVVNSFVGGRLTPILGAGAIKPLGVEAVGEAVVEALEDNELRGAIDVPEIESLASRAWRKRMA